MTRPVQVVPAILSDEPATLDKLVRQATTFTSYIQVDIMDGQFVPSKSIGWEDIARIKPKLNWEVHLMVLRPQDHVAGFQKAGASKIIFHYEATPKPQKVITAVRKLRLKVGLALKPETPVSAVLPLADQIDSVLFMTVHPGFYGAKFLPEVMDKVKELRRTLPEMEIAVDGGIKEGNIAEVARAGANVICVGSAVFLQPDPAAAYHRLVALARGEAT